MSIASVILRLLVLVVQPRLEGRIFYSTIISQHQNLFWKINYVIFLPNCFSVVWFHSAMFSEPYLCLTIDFSSYVFGAISLFDYWFLKLCFQSHIFVWLFYSSKCRVQEKIMQYCYYPVLLLGFILYVEKKRTFLDLWYIYVLILFKYL